MTLKNFIEALAGVLLQHWPDKNVYAHEIPQDVDGVHFVRMVDSNQVRGLDRRYIRYMTFEVVYFLKNKDTLDFLDWEDTMYDYMERLDVKEDEDVTRRIKTYNWQARQDSDNRMYQFIFDVAFNFVVEPDEIPTMYTLEELTRLKEVRQ